MDTFPALLAFCEGNPSVTDGFPSERPVTRSLDIFFDMRLNKWFANNRQAGDSRRHYALYDANVMTGPIFTNMGPQIVMYCIFGHIMVHTVIIELP